MIKIQQQTIAAVIKLRKRLIIVNSGMPLIIAYKDDGNIEFSINELDKDDFIINSDCLIENKGKLYLGTNKGKIYRSTDKAQSWQVVENVILESGVVLLYGYKNFLLAASRLNVIISRDDGDTWKIQEMPKEFALKEADIVIG